MRAVISAGPFSTNEIVTMTIEHLTQQGITTALVTDDDLDHNRVGQGAVDSKTVLVVATKEPIRAYYPAAEAAKKLVVVTESRISSTPTSMEALFWAATSLREDAKFRLMTPTARGSSEPIPRPRRRLSDSPHPGRRRPVECRRQTVRPETSLVSMLGSVEHNAPDFDLDLDRLRQILHTAYQWRYRPGDKLDITASALDQWLGRRNQVFVRAVLLTATLIAVATGILAWKASLGRAEWISMGAFTGLSFVTGSATRVNVPAAPDPGRWFPLGLHGVLTALVVTGCAWLLDEPLEHLAVLVVTSTLAHLLGWAVGAIRIDGVRESIKRGLFYPSAPGSVEHLERARELGLFASKREPPPTATLGGPAHALADHYVITNLALRDWLFGPGWQVDLED